MDINALTCENVEQLNSGNLNILGVFTEVFPPQVPTIWPGFTLFVDIVFDKHEEGTKFVFEALFFGPERQSVAKMITHDINVREMDGGYFSTQSFWEVLDVAVESFGCYFIEISINGKLAKRLPIWVKKLV